MLGQAAVRNALHDGGADSIGGGLDLLDHVVQQIVEDVPGIHRDFIQFRHNTIDAEGLIAQLAGKVPAVGEEVKFENLTLKVLSVEYYKVTQAEVTVSSTQEGAKSRSEEE